MNRTTAPIKKRAHSILKLSLLSTAILLAACSNGGGDDVASHYYLAPEPTGSGSCKGGYYGYAASTSMFNRYLK